MAKVKKLAVTASTGQRSDTGCGLSNVTSIEEHKAMRRRRNGTANAP
jgi:hypothetical protein